MIVSFVDKNAEFGDDGIFYVVCETCGTQGPSSPVSSCYYKAAGLAVDRWNIASRGAAVGIKSEGWPV
jgi:hypothetical protein